MKTEQVLLAISAITGVGLLAWTIKQGPVAPSIPTQSGGQQNYPFPSWSQASPVNTAAQFAPLVAPSLAPPAPVGSAGKNPAYLTFNFPSDSQLSLPSGPGDTPVPHSAIGGNTEPDSEGCGCGGGCGGGCSCTTSRGQMTTGVNNLISAIRKQRPDAIDKYGENTVSSGIALPQLTTFATSHFSFSTDAL